MLNPIFIMLLFAGFVSDVIAQNKGQQQVGNNAYISALDEPTKGDPNKESESPVVQLSNDEILTQNGLAWRKYHAIEEKNKSEKIVINYDSLYRVHAANRILEGLDADPEYYTVKIVPHTCISRILKTNSELVKYLNTPNKLFSVLCLPNLKALTAFKVQVMMVKDVCPVPQYSTAEIFNEILPTLVITEGNSLPLDSYVWTIEHYFDQNPEVIYYCNPSFLNLLVKRDYQTMMGLHIASPKTIRAN